MFCLPFFRVAIRLNILDIYDLVYIHVDDNDVISCDVGTIIVVAVMVVCSIDVDNFVLIVVVNRK